MRLINVEVAAPQELSRERDLVLVAIEEATFFRRLRSEKMAPAGQFWRGDCVVGEEPLRSEEGFAIRRIYHARPIERSLQ